MSKAGGVFGLQFDEPREAVVLPMVVKYLEEFNNSSSDEFDNGNNRHSYHRSEDVVSGGKGGGDLVRGRYDGKGARARTAAT